MDTKLDIIKKIEEYQTIVVCRHVRPDGDAVGSSIGLSEIIKATYPDKKVYAVCDDRSDYLSFFDYEIENDEKYYDDSLVIVVDCANQKRVSNKYLHLAKEIIKIDHHIEVEKFANINYVEEHSPACCQIIASFLMEFSHLKISDLGARALFLGIVTDTGRFRYDSVNKQTYEVSAYLNNYDLNILDLYNHLYSKEKEVLKLQGYIYNKFKTTRNGVSYIEMTKEVQEKYKVTVEEASSLVNSLEGIKGSLIWINFITQPTGEIRVRLRSRYVAIDKIANKYNGGGHACASGATVYSLDEQKQLIKDCDKLLKEYKKLHPEVF